MLVKISEQEWNLLRKGKAGDSVFCDPVFVYSVAGIYGVKPAFYCWNENDHFSLGFAAYVKNSRIVQPYYLFYAGFIYDSQKSKQELSASFNALADHLKKHFRSVYWKTWLASAMDMDVLKPAYFISSRKTYIKRLDDLTYKHDINRRIRAAVKNGIVLTVDKDQEQALDWHCNEFLNKYHRNRQFIKRARDLFILLHQNNLLSYYHAYFNGKLAASQILLKDEAHRTAYLWHLTSDPAWHKLGAHSALYDFFFRDLRAKGYERVDMGGANIPTIAAYKARFLPDMHIYYELGYVSPLRILARKIRKQMNNLLGRA